jgi:holo-[acyl-carrier protein] synthase
VFTPHEVRYARAAVDPGERFAARFAAKEAAMKTLGVGLGAVRFSEIAIVRTDSGAPQLVVEGAASELAAELGITGWLVTLSHSDTTAIAVVAGLGS